MINIKKLIMMVALACLIGVSLEAQDRLDPPENCQCGNTTRKAVCPRKVPREVLYRPSYDGCEGNAAVLMQGTYADSFSVVVRDSLNRDRFPLPGSSYGGCSASLAGGDTPPRECSAFKASKEYFTKINKKRTRVVCFPEKGTSRIFRDVKRITIKVTDSAESLRRFCLYGPKEDLN